MNKLPPFAHGMLDYILVFYFLAAPSLFTLTPTVGTISYLLAVIHLMLTIFTNYPMGIKKSIPFRVHGLVELIVAILLMLMPVLMGESVTFYDSLFFILTGASLVVIWLTSRYKKPTEAAPDTAPLEQPLRKDKEESPPKNGRGGHPK